MREILFKAKRLDNGEWVEGYYVERDNKSWIYPAGNQVISKSLARELRPFHSAKSTQRIMKEVFPVAPSTVCEYTGMTDKDGKKIFEGDILNENGEHFTVVYDSNWAKFKLQYLHAIQYPEWNRGVLMEVVGSIHDGEGGQHEGNE